MSTSSVSQHPEAPPVSRSRSHSSATTLEVIKESEISVVKKRPGRPRKISESEEKSQTIVKKTPSHSSRKSVTSEKPTDKKQGIHFFNLKKNTYLMVYNFKKLYIFLAEIPGIKTPNTRSSRKSVSTSSVSQHPEPPPVTRSRSHSSATSVLDTMFTPVKSKPSRTTVSQNFQKLVQFLWKLHDFSPQG